MDQEDRSAPQITITDPNSPGDLVDVLGGGVERDAWRPSRRLLAVSAVVVLVVAAVAVPVVVLHQRALDRAADRASLAQLDVTFDDTAGGEDGDPHSTSPTLPLSNNGPETVRVVGVRVDREGYTHQSVDLTIPAHHQATVPVAIEKDCPDRLPNEGPGGVLLELVSTRGVKTTVRVPTRTSVWATTYERAVQITCSLYGPDESVLVELAQLLQEKRSLRIVVDLRNRAKGERQLDELRAPTGMIVTTDQKLPLAVPHDGGAPLELTVRLTVSDCVRARALFPPLDSGAVPTEPLTLTPADTTVSPRELLVSGPPYAGDSQVAMSVSGDGEFAGNLPLIYDLRVDNAIQALVQSSCTP